MPRNNRSTALILILALVGCLAAQTASAMPVATGPSGTEVAAGSALTTLWAWFTSRFGTILQAKSAASPDPNSGTQSAASPDPNSGTQSAASPDPNSGSQNTYRHLAIRDSRQQR